ncbi:hypothetical protein BLS_003518 [Venturia inaequalis]|uniref:Uncharacterized protein n=1 Tax=Venturia inaequalis TaxID=5025 RepID=A0A8H3UI06_VENIN|nr:hypothetical protein BLS_003518 [Venturia inaequalis]KAE9969756.1 hypothetical protein EG328_006687 [Venturia inaequalis]KAE9982001.1 hypothetical protein EG327_005980 [Venturia inaequalis]RDI80681.1 putative amino-acid permease [Venturia inaequalis]
MLNSLLTSTLLATSALSAVVSAQQGLPKWKVTNFNGACARQGCTYDFTISSPPSGSIPSFSAKCSGEEKRAELKTYFKPCNVNDGGLGNRGVGAKYMARESIDVGTYSALIVTFAYTDLSSASPGFVHNYTGQAPITINQSSGPAYDFIVTPKESV